MIGRSNQQRERGDGPHSEPLPQEHLAHSHSLTDFDTDYLISVGARVKPRIVTIPLFHPHLSEPIYIQNWSKPPDRAEAVIAKNAQILLNNVGPKRDIFSYCLRTSRIEDQDDHDSIDSDSDSERSAPDLSRSYRQKPDLVVSDTVLGRGSNGTVVYKGAFQGHAVAVKRMVAAFVDLASREVDLLLDSKTHSNVIRYFYRGTQTEGFIDLALELCDASLASVIQNKHHELAPSLKPKKALHQITSGIKHLHDMDVIHRDIKPQNILVAVDQPRNGEKELRMLVSDLGLASRLDEDQTSIAPNHAGAGTTGWKAPETLAASDSNGTKGAVVPTRLRKSVDIFSLGCLYYFVLTSGEHPYGKFFERDANVMKDTKSLQGIQSNKEAYTLVWYMIQFEESERHDVATCLQHPFFWSADRILCFLQEVSDALEPLDNSNPIVQTLEENGAEVIGPKLNWFSSLDDDLAKAIAFCPLRNYRPGSIRDLVRAIRNQKHHYHELPDHIKNNLSPMPDGFWAYFSYRFPLLLMRVYSRIRASGLYEEPAFATFFKRSSCVCFVE